MGNAECTAKFGIPAETPRIAITRTYDQSPIVYEGNPTDDDLADFAYDASIPVMVDIRQHEDLADIMFEEWRPSMILITNHFTEEAYFSVY